MKSLKIYFFSLLLLGTLVPSFGNLSAIAPQQFFQKAPDGAEIRTVLLQQGTQTGQDLKSTQPKTVLIFLPGRGGFFEKGEDFLQILTGETPFLDQDKKHPNPFSELKADVWCLEYRAHGKSGGRLPGKNYQRGHITDFQIYLDDVHRAFTDLIQAKYPAEKYPGGIRYVVMGLSMGGQLALQYAQKYDPPISGIISMAPMLDFYTDVFPRWMARSASCLLKSMGFGKAYAFGYHDYDPKAQKFMQYKTHHNRKSFDDDLKVMIDNPSMRTGGPTFAWVCAAFKAEDETNNPEALSRIKAPVTFILAGDDATVNNTAVLQAANHIPQASIEIIPKAWHNLIRESDPFRIPILERIYEDISSF